MAIYKESDEETQTQAPGAEVTGEEEANLSFKKIIEKDRSRRKIKIISLICTLLFFIAGAAIAGFLFFSQTKKFGDNNIKFEINGPEKIKIGEKFDYLIKYNNLDKLVLLNSLITIQLPHGFILETAEPAANDNHVWPLGDLSFMRSGEIKLTGKIVDDITREQKITATLNFYPENFHSEFSKPATLTTSLETPDMDFLAQIPANVTANQKININLKLKNTSSIGFDDAKIVLTKPENFTVKNTNPTADKDTYEWKIARMDPFSDVTEIKIEGAFPQDLTFTKDTDRTQNFSFQLFLKGQDEQYYLAKETKFSTKIIEQALNVFLIINGSTENRGFSLGDKLTYSLVAKNSGQQTFKDVQLKTVINSTPFDVIDWNKIKDENFGKIEKTDKGKEITWSKTQINELNNFGPGSEKTITFSLSTKSLEDLKTQTPNIDLSLLGKTLIDSYSEIIFTTTDTDITPIKSSPVQFQLNTNTELQTKALYYFEDGTAIGTGPVPPKANEKTKLQIFWIITNELHEINNISVTTTLPDNINWTNETHLSTGEINFDATTRKLIWTINRLPKNIQFAQANFAIEFTPKTEDIGNIMKLTNNTTLSAFDSITSTTIMKTKTILTSNMEEDEIAKGQGVVIP